MATKLNFVLVDGLSYIERAELAHDYVKRTGRAFYCQPCAAASGHIEATEEAASQVVAVLIGEKGELMPLCEVCYERMVEQTQEFRWGNGAMHVAKA
jgi:hypothetical protein